VDIERATDEELIRTARQTHGADADRYLDALYSRYYRRVATWCLRLSRDRQEAADLAQEVFLRVHSHIGGFRLDSRFSTWLYTVLRSVSINRGVSASRREAGRVEIDRVPEPVDIHADPRKDAEHSEEVDRLRAAMSSELEPLEARVLYLHYVNGLTLRAITRLLDLDNRSGAKAFVVSGIRKLKRHFGGAVEGGLRAVGKP
jgi:RNA polymerase sigma-70 factor (ECF subfamily)